MGTSIGGKIATRTHVYGFGTIVNSKSLFDVTSRACTNDSVCGLSTSHLLVNTSFNDDRIEKLEKMLKLLTDDVSQVKKAIGDISHLMSQFEIMLNFKMETLGEAQIFPH